MDISIHTINARGNCMLEVIRNHFDLSNAQMFQEINSLALSTIDILKNKGIDYKQLRSSLVPQTNRCEAGFIFDTQKIKSHSYGIEVIKKILPLLNLKSNNCILCGDLVGDDQNFIFTLLQESLILSRDLNFVHGSALYCVYINNLSESSLEEIHNALSSCDFYAGFILGKFSSRAKIYLSTILVNAFLKSGDKILMGHEDDRSNEENINILGFPFKDFNLKIFSLQSMYFDTLLSYKIERPVFPGFEADTEMALNAISNQILNIDDCKIELEDAKHNYLKSEKAGKLKKADIAQLTKDNLSELIRLKVSSSYLYNLSYSAEHNVAKFNIMLEIPGKNGGYPTRIVVALEYKPNQRLLRVITMC